MLRCNTDIFDSIQNPTSADERDVASSESMLSLLETIDDDLDEHDLALVKISDPSAAAEYGIDAPPAVVYFENGIPSLCKGEGTILFL